MDRTDQLQGIYRPDRPLNFAHRGARRQAPENTLPAFTRALELGADGVELDVQLSADMVPVIIHNGTVNATTDGSGQVAKLSLDALRELDAGSHLSAEFAGTRIPTLDEVFELIGRRLLINVELKDFKLNSPLPEIVIDRVRAHGLEQSVLFSSFNPFMLRATKRLAPEMPAGYLYAPGLPLPLAKGWLARPVIGPHEARHPHFSMVDTGYMNWARQHGYRVNVWTVNEPEDMQQMIGLGVDMIITDVPDVLHQILVEQMR